MKNGWTWTIVDKIHNYLQKEGTYIHGGIQILIAQRRLQKASKLSAAEFWQTIHNSLPPDLFFYSISQTQQKYR